MKTGLEHAVLLRVVAKFCACSSAHRVEHSNSREPSAERIRVLNERSSRVRSPSTGKSRSSEMESRTMTGRVQADRDRDRNRGGEHNCGSLEVSAFHSNVWLWSGIHMRGYPFQPAASISKCTCIVAKALAMVPGGMLTCQWKSCCW